MHRVVQAIPEGGYVLRIRFSTGEEGLFDAAPYLEGPIYDPLKDPEYFRHVEVDELAGTICWPNGADFCPDVLYQDAVCGASARQERP